MKIAKQKFKNYLEKIRCFLNKKFINILKKINKNPTPEEQINILKKQTDFAKASQKNPYLQSKALWNDMYGSLQTRLENAYRVIFILAVVIVVAMLGFVIVAGETKVEAVPFVIHGNEVLTANEVGDSEYQHLKIPLASYFIQNFIRDARTVSVDGDMNANHKMAAFSFVTGEATEVLKNFYAKNDPDEIANHYVKSVSITSILQASPHTIDVRWCEAWRNIDSGTLVRSHHYIAEITYEYGKASQNITILRFNPLGLQIKTLSWSMDQTM